MAIMSSNFWTTMSVGRLAWASLAGLISSAWPALYFNTAVCLLSSLLLLSRRELIVWLGALGIGMGVSFTFPAAITLPPEIGIEMSPRMMTSLQLAGSFGEMFGPFAMGVGFEMHRYSLFGGLLLCWQTIALLMLAFGWSFLKNRLCFTRGEPTAETELAVLTAAA